MLKDLQSILVRAMNDEDPVGYVRKHSESLPEADRKLLEGADDEGLLLSGLVVRKLRFERLCRGDKRLEEWFDRDPERFTAAFKGYSRAIAATEYFPRDEANAFRDWCEKNNFAEPGAAKDVKE